jgi:D-alanyl-D-alanine carboxypeptidase/D-alanyl-D-alanine-endopeptidase (penicillin-binding protein 4)
VRKINKLVILCLLLKTAFALEVNIPETLTDKVAIAVIDLDNNKKIYSYRANQPMLLASNMKVVTSYVALQKLGWDFNWQTKLGYSGTIEGSTLKGNLYLIGGGDPFLNSNTINNILQSFKANSGINQIDGNIILDSSIFNNKPKNSELHPEPYATYSVEPDGLLIDKDLTPVPVRIKNGKISLVKPDNLQFKLLNNLKYLPSKASCNDANDYVTIRKTTKNTLSLTGSLPQKCNRKQIGIYLGDDFKHDQEVIKKSLKEAGVSYSLIESGIAPTDINTIMVHHSESINTLLPIMNQMSDNTYAKTLFMSLGAYKSNNSDTYANSLQVYKQTLAKNFDFTELRPENGAGLSRHEKLTAEHMTELLQTIYDSQDYDKFRLSLPTPAESGTLGHDFKGYRKQLYVKTGTLDDVKAYSGYFTSNNGHSYAISIIANDIKTNGSTTELSDFKQLFTNILSKLTNDTPESKH